MNKKGFTLIELIVSITLVSIILVSLLATLVKLKQTYEVIDEDSDIRKDVQHMVDTYHYDENTTHGIKNKG